MNWILKILLISWVKYYHFSFLYFFCSLYITGCKTDLIGNFSAKHFKTILAASMDCCENIAFSETELLSSTWEGNSLKTLSVALPGRRLDCYENQWWMRREGDLELSINIYNKHVVYEREMPLKKTVQERWSDRLGCGEIPQKEVKLCQTLLTVGWWN